VSDWTEIADVSGIPADLIEGAANLLQSFPGSGRLNGWDSNTVTAAQMLGFIELHETKKRCQHCGAEKHDYSYYKIAPGGRLFLAMIAVRKAGEA
jgi:hypothetical protein